MCEADPSDIVINQVPGATSGTTISLVAVGGIAFGSSSIYCSATVAGTADVEYASAYGSHCLSNVNDGLYGNSYSWIPGASYNGRYEPS